MMAKVAFLLCLVLLAVVTVNAESDILSRSKRATTAVTGCDRPYPDPVDLAVGDQATWTFSGAGGSTPHCGHRFRTTPPAKLQISCNVFILASRQALRVRDIGSTSDIGRYTGTTAPVLVSSSGHTMVVILARQETSPTTRLSCTVTAIGGPSPPTTPAPTTPAPTTPIATTTPLGFGGG